MAPHLFIPILIIIINTVAGGGAVCFCDRSKLQSADMPCVDPCLFFLFFFVLTFSLYVSCLVDWTLLIQKGFAI